MTQKGRGIFLGKPVGVPTGLCIGRPGLLIFAGSDEIAREAFILDITDMVVDLTALEVQLNG